MLNFTVGSEGIPDKMLYERVLIRLESGGG